VQIDRLANAQIAKLRLLEIGVNPDLVERTDRHQALPDLNVVARIDISSRHDPINLRDNVAIAKVEFSLSKIPIGRLEFCLGLLDPWCVLRQPSERAVYVALGVQLLELFDHHLWTLGVRMDNTKLGRAVNQVRLRLQNRRESLIQVWRYLIEIPLLGLSRQS